MGLPKVSVIGAGHVGATTAHLIALKGLANVTLIDIVDGLAEGKALDMQQSAAVEGFDSLLEGTTDLEALKDSRLVVITAGLARKPGMSRDDLVAANSGIVGPIAERIARIAPDAIIIPVTNPLDVMVHLVLERTGFPRERVLGMAGVLDSARLRTFIALRLGVAPSSVEAMILGSHGDLMVPIQGSIKVGGKPASELLSADEIQAICERARKGGAEIVKLLKQGSAYYAPASSAVSMVEAVLKDTHAVLPACVRLAGEYNLEEVCIGVPVKLGKTGLEQVVEYALTPDEQRALENASGQVKQMAEALSKTAG